MCFTIFFKTSSRQKAKVLFTCGTRHSYSFYPMPFAQRKGEIRRPHSHSELWGLILLGLQKLCSFRFNRPQHD